ncbi:hypothetical protein [Parasitella parasitica]|uniref:Resolvase HTH domain-containing protein n=1 Tax=Parasitella parasitica TaxID=35722 RepID=A0A0B7MVR9_9FUNG|nr:hypothetical protein [Parasitella parasitica]
MTVEEIAKKIGKSASRVYKVLDRRDEEQCVEPRKSRGRPSELSARVILRMGALTSSLKSTIRRALYEAGGNNRVAQLKPILS